MKKIRLLLCLALALLTGANVANADELTVYDGTTTNENVPLRPYYGDTSGQKSEFIIPSSQLEDMIGGTITQMQFKLSSSSSKAWTAKYQVFIKEVEQTEFEIVEGTGYYSTSTATPIGSEGAVTVYTGAITPSGTVVPIEFTTPYEYNGGNLLVGIYMTSTGSYESKSFYGTTVQNSSWAYVSSSNKPQNFIPATTFTYEAKADGPALKVKEYKNEETLSFGMVNPGSTKTITLVNPGTEAITVNIATTGGFTVDMTTATIAANKGEQVVTITAPNETANGTITITPTVEGVDPITINLSCVIKDPSKFFVDFNDNVLPEGWETKGVGSYTTGDYASGYVWDFSKGYAWYKSSASNAGFLGSYYHSLISPLVKFVEGEKLLFKVKKEPSSSSYLGYLRVDYSTDGTTWTAATDGTFNDAALTTDWAEKEVTIPATTKKIRFVAAGIALDDIYGGEYSTAPVMKVTASDMAFGMVDAEASATFTIKNEGKSELTGIEVTSSDPNFTIENAPASVAVGETATVTVKMSADNKGMHEGTVTVSAPEQETKTFNVSGYVMDTDLFTETFDGNELPSGWTMESGSTYTDYKWTFENGIAYATSSNARLITPALTVAEGEKMAIEIKKHSTWNCTLPIYISKDGGDFTLLKTIANADLSDTDYKLFFIEGLEAGSYKIRFDGNSIDMNAVNGFHLDQNAPIMEMTSKEAAAFGMVTETVSKEYTVKNAGTGTLVVNIASDNTKFAVSPEQLSIGAGEENTFSVTYNFVSGEYGISEGNITVTPTYNESLAVTIKASAKAVDPDAWTETFDTSDNMPFGWDANKFSVSTYSYTKNPNPTNVALSESGGVLVTPRLHANENDILMWEAYFNASNDHLTVEYLFEEAENPSWVTLYDYYSPQNDGAGQYDYGWKKDMQFQAPAEGHYYLRFTPSWNNTGLDNFNGFQLDLPEHDIRFVEQTISSQFTQFIARKVYVTVKELAGENEDLTVQFFIGENNYGETTGTLEAGSEQEFEIEVTLNDEIEGKAYFKVFNKNREVELTTEEVDVTLNGATFFDETIAPEDLSTGWQNGSMSLKYTAKKGWNTFCVPFQPTDADFKAIFGEDCKVYEMDNYKDGELVFSVPNWYTAGYPYIVYSESPVTLGENGYITGSLNIQSATGRTREFNDAKFIGTFAPIAAPGMEGKYGVVPSTGRIQKGGARASLKGYRAYFELPADADPSKLAITIDGQPIATGIDALEMINELNGDVYDLQGRKVNRAQKGVFIQNGKKVVVK